VNQLKKNALIYLILPFASSITAMGNENIKEDVDKAFSKVYSQTCII
jgi:hypothetical protein